MHWEDLILTPLFRLKRSGRFVIADLLQQHRVMTTSAGVGGQTDVVRHLVNHQSCEGAGHLARHQLIAETGPETYHAHVCAELDLAPDRTAVMGTAANMNYVAIVTAHDLDVAVTAVVTAGVEGNATTAGDEASWRETADGVGKVALPAGTINTMVLINLPLTASALARSVVTMTEGKSAALQRLAVPSKLHMDLATGTGTDQFCLAAPLEGAMTLTSASPHMKLGELIGRATRDATLEALRWQNGLELSYTRGVFHALGRYGVREATLMDDIAAFMEPADLELLRRNSKAVFYEPLVGAAAHALATVADRVRHGTFPQPVAADALVQHAATLAANLSAQVHRWPEFRVALRPHAEGDVKTLVLRALALGWSEKWRTG